MVDPLGLQEQPFLGPDMTTVTAVISSGSVQGP